MPHIGAFILNNAAPTIGGAARDFHFTTLLVISPLFQSIIEGLRGQGASGQFLLFQKKKTSLHFQDYKDSYGGKRVKTHFLILKIRICSECFADTHFCFCITNSSVSLSVSAAMVIATLGNINELFQIEWD